MQITQLYIQNEKVDLFDDEIISLTQTIQNVRDISKIFTPFSKSFSLPASKTNNKLFKHYYNFDIDNGFDARKKVNATIELNYIPFQEGKIQLQGVDMRNNKPYAYKVVFYGNTVNLKDILGEDKLSSLSWLSGFTRTYNAAQVKTDLQANGIDLTNSFDSTLYTDAYVMPLIACKTRLFYRTLTGGGVQYFNDDGTTNPNGGNLFDHSGSGSPHQHGLYWQELKYGIRAYLIVKAIEESYDDIEFTSDSFILDTSIAQYYNLYMWMHRRKGFVFDDAEGNIIEERYEGFSTDTTQMTRVVMVNDYLKVFNLTGGQTLSYSLEVTRSSGTNPYTVTIKKDGVVYASDSGSGSSITMTGSLTNSSTGYDVYIEGTATEQFDCEWVITDSYIGTGETGTYTGATQTLASNFQFRASEQIPEMKVIDFLTGLFKLFNLTAYVQSDGKIKVQTLDDFYATGIERDITDYVDISQSSVDVALPYKEIKFEYIGRGTETAQLYEQKEGKGWGTEEYKVDNSLSGEVYSVEVPFEHMQFEKLTDNGTALSNLQVGNFIEGDNAYFGQPLLFYWQRYSGTSISYLPDDSTHETVSTYCVPLNSVTGTSTDSNHFSVELNEFLPTTTLTGSLFANYYQDYISDVFNSKRRLTKVKAYLPTRFLITYSLADTLRIADREYKINSITTNLNTGESDLELLNIV
jgi:hypothetical protein